MPTEECCSSRCACPITPGMLSRSRARAVNAETPECWEPCCGTSSRQQRGAKFRLFCPDETTSNRLQAVFDATSRAFEWPLVPTDEFLSADGRVMEILSEHCCQGWLEGYLLTGRHGIFACYEAFITIVDSMVAQYAKWSKLAREVPWRKPVASLNYLLTITSGSRIITATAIRVRASSTRCSPASAR